MNRRLTTCVIVCITLLSSAPVFAQESHGATTPPPEAKKSEPAPAAQKAKPAPSNSDADLNAAIARIDERMKAAMAKPASSPPEKKVAPAAETKTVPVGEKKAVPAAVPTAVAKPAASPTMPHITLRWRLNVEWPVEAAATRPANRVTLAWR